MANSIFKFSIPHQSIFSIQLSNKKLKLKEGWDPKTCLLLSSLLTTVDLFPNATLLLSLQWHSPSPTSLSGFPCSASASHVTWRLSPLPLANTVSDPLLWATLYRVDFEAAHNEPRNTGWTCRFWTDLATVQLGPLQASVLQSTKQTYAAYGFEEWMRKSCKKLITVSSHALNTNYFCIKPLLGDGRSVLQDF